MLAIKPIGKVAVSTSRYAKQIWSLKNEYLPLSIVDPLLNFYFRGIVALMDQLRGTKLVTGC